MLNSFKFYNEKKMQQRSKKQKLERFKLDMWSEISERYLRKEYSKKRGVGGRKKKKKK